MDSEVAQLLLLMVTASVEQKRAAPLNSVAAIAAELIFGAVLVCIQLLVICWFYLFLRKVLPGVAKDLKIGESGI